MTIKKTLAIIGVVVLALAIYLTWIWVGIDWWKSLILFILYGWSLNLDNHEKG